MRKNSLRLIFVLSVFFVSCSDKAQVVEQPATNKTAVVKKKSATELIPEKKAKPIINKVAEGTLLISLEKCLELALGGNVQIQLGELSVAERADDYFIAHEVFDPSVYFNNSFSDSRTPVSSTFLGATVLEDKVGRIETGVKKKWLLGTRTDLIWVHAHTRTNSATTSVNPRNEDEFKILLEQPLLQGFGVEINRQELLRAIKQKKISNEEFEITLESKLLEVYRQYWQLVLSSQEFEIQKFSFDLETEKLKEIQEKFKVGLLSKLSLLEQQSKLATVKKLFLQTQHDLLKASDDLLISIKPDAKLKDNNLRLIPSTQPADKLSPATVVELDILIKQGLNQRAELRRLELLKQIADIDLLLAKNKRMPNLIATGSYSLKGLDRHRDKSRHQVERSKNYNWSVGLNLEFLFHSDSRIAKWRQALSQQRGLDFSKSELVASVISEISLAQLELKHSYEMLQASKKEIEYGQAQFENQQALLDVGRATILNKNMYALKLMKAENNYFQSKIEVYLARALLKVTTGNFSRDILKGIDSNIKN